MWGPHSDCVIKPSTLGSLTKNLGLGRDPTGNFHLWKKQAAGLKSGVKCRVAVSTECCLCGQVSGVISGRAGCPRSRPFFLGFCAVSLDTDNEKMAAGQLAPRRPSGL